MAATQLSRFPELPIEVQILIWTFAATPGDKPPPGQSLRVSLRCMCSWIDPTRDAPALWEYFCRVSGLFRMAPPYPTTTDAEHARIQLMVSCRLGRQVVLEILKREVTAITRSTVRGYSATQFAEYEDYSHDTREDEARMRMLRGRILDDLDTLLG